MSDTLLAAIRHAGADLELDGDRLHLRAPAGFPPELREQIRAHRDELVAALQGEARAGGLEHVSVGIARVLRRFIDGPYAGFYRTTGTRDPALGDAACREAEEYQRGRRSTQ